MALVKRFFCYNSLTDYKIHVPQFRNQRLKFPLLSDCAACSAKSSSPGCDHFYRVLCLSLIARIVFNVDGVKHIEMCTNAEQHQGQEAVTRAKKRHIRRRFSGLTKEM